MKQKVICIGAVLVDELFYCGRPVVPGTSNPAILKRSAGGVMRNIAHHLALLGIPVQFITVIGDDADGVWLKNICEQAGINMNTTLMAPCKSGKYAALLNPDGSLYAAAAVNPCEEFLTIGLLERYAGVLSSATIMVADTNIDREVLEWLIIFCRKTDIRLIIEPVSVEKAKKIAGVSPDGLFMITPNEDELSSLSRHDRKGADVINELLDLGVQNIWLRKGAMGSEMISPKGSYALPSPKVNVKDITGAGDAALAGWIAAHCMGLAEMQCLETAHTMAAAVLQVEGAIDKDIDHQKLFSSVKTYYPDEQ